MTGQIPPYGKNFRRESLPWSEHRANRQYVLKSDSQWTIRSDNTSEIWQIYHYGYPVGTPTPTFKKAMDKLLDGIAQGFYFTHNQHAKPTDIATPASK